VRSTGRTTGVRLLVDGAPVTGTWIVDQEWIDATPEFENDPDWVHVDSHGHTHRWMTGPPPLVPLTKPQQEPGVLLTLRDVLDPEPHWCELCNGDYQPGHYECVLCGDEVTSGTRAFAGRNYILGLEYVTIDVDKAFPLGPVTVTRLDEPTQSVEGQVVSCNVAREMTGTRVESSHIVATGPVVP
jgi:hypothetical protein